MNKNPNISLPFEKPLPADWKLAAQQELQGALPETLILKKGNLEIQPIYFESGEKSFNDYSLKPSVNVFGGPRYWANMPRIVVNDAIRSNALALEYLNTGADGILFDIRNEHVEANTLLKDIRLDICPVSFILNGSKTGLALEISKFIDSKNSGGACFWIDEPVELKKISEAFKELPFHPFGITIDSQTETDSEIANALTRAIELIEKAVGQGIQPRQIIEQICFSIQIGSDFFTETAKLKSLRQLWKQVAGAYGVVNSKPLHIHAISPAWVNEKYQPHGNMIKATTAAMSAILGGCDALTVEPEDSANAMMNRIARNVSSIIREESHFAKVADATAGSYYLNALTEQLSQQAWQKFQSMNS